MSFWSAAVQADITAGQVLARVRRVLVAVLVRRLAVCFLELLGLSSLLSLLLAASVASVRRRPARPMVAPRRGVVL